MLSLLFTLVAVALLGLLLVAALVAFAKLTGIRMPVTARDAEPVTKRRPMFDSLTLRGILIALLAVLMLVPLSLVNDIVSERGSRHQEVLADIARTWGEPQTLVGPVLVLPYTGSSTVEDEVINADGTARTITRTVRKKLSVRILPTALDIDVQLQDELRQRGIFSSLVYNADITLDARFDSRQVSELPDSTGPILWSEARLVLGLSDTRAINEVSEFTWNEQALSLSPGTQLDELPSGFHAAIPELDGTGEYRLAMRMNAKGSGLFQFAPLGETTKVTLHSNWPHPSFQGSALPNTHDISDDGFSASWEIPHLARNYPQSWSGDQTQDLYEFTAGVSMYETVSLYSQVTRAAKYGLLFAGLTFLTLFIFEVTLARPLHAVQYVLVGVALSVFYLVLLALSEHMNFLRSYASAAALTILMISLYTAAVLRSFARGLGILTMLVGLYATLYSLLQLEDYALLFGTALIVLILGVLMLVTRDLSTRAVGTDAPPVTP